MLNFAVSAEPPNYDCHGATSFAFIHPVRPHYNTLLKFDEPNYPKVKGDLAQSWEMSPDGLTYTFKLKPNIKFHDGTPMTSADVKASYERIGNPPKGVVSIRKAAYDDIASIETPDPQTVVFKLKERNASMLTNFASPWDCIYSAAKLKADPKFPEKNVLGTGPFKFVEHEAGSRWVGERFADYFEKDRPYLDGFRGDLHHQHGGERERVAGRRSAGGVPRPCAGRPRPSVKARSATRSTCTSRRGCAISWSPSTPRRSRSTTRACAARCRSRSTAGRAPKALSKIALVRDVGGVLRPGYSLAANEKRPRAISRLRAGTSTNPAPRRRQLLAEAGVKDLKFKFMNRNVPMPYTQVGVFLIDQWRQIGVTAEHEQPETRAYIANLRSGNYEVGLDFNCDAVDDPNLQLIEIHLGRQVADQLRPLHRREARRALRTAERELDQKKRYAILREFEKHALDEAYTFPTIWWHRIIVNWQQIKGWHMSPSHYLNQDLQDVWLDQ